MRDADGLWQTWHWQLTICRQYIRPKILTSAGSKPCSKSPLSRPGRPSLLYPVTVDSSLILRILRTELPRGGFSQKYFLFWLQWGNSQTSGKCINLFKVWQIFWVTTSTTTTVYCPKSFVKYLKEKHFCCRNESEKSEFNINFISDNIYQRTSAGPHLKQIF